MRCDKPIELAKSILTFDSIPRKANPFRADTLDSLLAKPENLPIPLIEQIPIYVVYETVAAEKENLIFHLDLYRREEELVKILKGKK
jgi:murein L,D-transpeptidase YcbB/YkuD